MRLITSRRDDAGAGALDIKEEHRVMTEQEALVEANRCYLCIDAPCIQGCPVEIPIEKFIRRIRFRDYSGAARVIRDANAMPLSCAIVCPPEETCGGTCSVLEADEPPIRIGELQRFAIDWDRHHGFRQKRAEVTRPQRIAVVGSSGVGLGAARELALLGYAVTIFEALPYPGGITAYGVPRYKITKEQVLEDVQETLDLGVELKLNSRLGRDFTLQDLKDQGYEAIVLGIGADRPRFPNLAGQDLKGIYTAREWLEYTKVVDGAGHDHPGGPRLGKKVIVVGAGNTAVDASSTAVHLCGGQVSIVYRRSFEQMPLWPSERERASRLGVKFEILMNPVEFLGDDEGWVRGLRCQRMRLGEPDASGRPRPIPIEGSEVVLDTDMVILAIGQETESLVQQLGLKCTGDGLLAVDEEMRTSDPMVFAGGDVVNGGKTLVQALGDGKKAAMAIHGQLSGQNIDLFASEPPPL